MKKTVFLVFSVGFALFSMFFGSGNLVFPLVVGKESGGHFWSASFGIWLTGVVVPFLGVLGMMLYQGEFKQFFRLFGKTGIFLFSLASLALMGPFGVLPRCLTVAHGALEMLIPGLPLEVASGLFCLAIYFMAANKSKIIPALGTILTPLLLVAIGCIAFFGLKEKSFEVQTSQISAVSAFTGGFFQGYQTMDLLAAFFFSTFIIKQLQSLVSKETSRESSLKVFWKSALVGGGILSVVYVGLVLLGSLYSSELTGIAHPDLLGFIAVKTLGSLGAPVLCAVVILACLTTAVVLASLFAEFSYKSLLKEKISEKKALIGTLLIGFLVSTFGFSAIASFIAPILEVIYPALIVLTVINILHKLLGLQVLNLASLVERGFGKRKD